MREEMADQVPVTRLYRTWSGPALTDPDAVPLAIGMHVLGGLASSRLDNILVRDEQLAVSVTASAQQFEQVSFLQATMDVKPGVDPAVAEKRFDEVIAELVNKGPSEDELTRAATQIISGQIGALELVGGFSGKGATLAEGLLYAGDPAHYKKELEQMAALTPAQVQATLQRWLSRPAYTLTVVPGERTEDGALMGGWGDEGTVPPPSPDAKAPPPPLTTGPKREFPPVAPVGELTFPQVEHATLSNGIPVTLARRTAIPKVSLALSFDAGTAADGSAHAGTQSLMMDMLEEGTTSRSAVEIAEEQERLGASIGASTSTDSSVVSMSALTANLRPSLELMADMVRNPAFAASEVARVKNQRLADIAQEQASPGGLAMRALGPLIYGPEHPYGSVGVRGTAEVIEALTPETLSSAHAKWLRPDLVRITAVGNVTMAELVPALEEAFGDGRAPATPQPVKNLDVPVPPAARKLVVIDRPNSPQSVVVLARVLPVRGTQQGMEALSLANEVIGNGFLSRLNQNIREDKGWSYGVRSSISGVTGNEPFTVSAPVQADRTADSIRLILADMDAFASGAKGVDETELQRVTDGNIRGLPNSYQTNSQVLGALLNNQQFGRPDDYQKQLPDILSAIDAAKIDAAAQQYLSPDNLAIVVVGDRREIDDQLKTLDMPIEYLNAEAL
jgi:predicted Zn-dependent peptidase